MLVLLLRTANTTLTIEKIDTNSGFIEIKLGNVEIVRTYDIILHIINPAEILKIIACLEENISKLQIEKEGRDILFHELDSLKYKIHTIIPHRQKRGLINIVGTGMKWLYGTMDEDDRQNIEEHLKIIDENNHNIITQNNKQVFINNSFNQTFLTLKETIEKDRTKISYQLVNSKKDIVRINNKFLYLESLLKIGIIKDNVEHIQNNIASSRTGIMGNNILSKEEIIKYDVSFEKLKNIKIGTALYENEKIVFVIKIPSELIETRKYLVTSLTNMNSEELIIDDEEIVKINETVYKYELNIDFKNLRKSNLCLYNSVCMKTKNSQMKIHEIENGLLLLKNVKNINLSSTCDERTTHLNGNFLLNFNSCELKIQNETFVNRKNIFEERFIIPYEINLNTTQEQLSFNDIVIKQIENIENINELKFNHKNHVMFNICIGIIILLLIINLIIYVYIKSKKLRRTFYITQESFHPKEGEVISRSGNQTTTDVPTVATNNNGTSASTNMTKSNTHIGLPIDWTR